MFATHSRNSYANISIYCFDWESGFGSDKVRYALRIIIIGLTRF